MKIKNLKLKINQKNPIQYQKGWVEFYKLRFKVTPDTLIPRPETELLVDEVIRFLSNHPERPKGVEGSLTILDIGTGTGNIAISLAKNLASHFPSGNTKIIATDVSESALNVAKQNAQLHGVEKQIFFIKSNLLSFVIPTEVEGSYTTESGERDSSTRRLARNDNVIIVTNLPYIPTQRIPYLDSSVKDFEPHIALDGGRDGFNLYRKLFQQISGLQTRFGNEATNRVWQPKLIICEIDYTHGELAREEAQKYFPKSDVEVKTDLTHKQRILIIRSRS